MALAHAFLSLTAQPPMIVFLSGIIRIWGEKMTLADHSILTLADGPVADSMTYEEFETSLIHGILFDPGFFLIDAYLFASDHLRKHIFESAEGSMSLFELAMREGVISLVSREPSSGFPQLLHTLRDMRIQSPFTHGDRIADRLAASVGPLARPIPWPEGMGQNYGSLLRRCLRGDEPTGLAPGAWQETEVLRHEGLDVAAELSSQRREAPGGIRRGELIRAAGAVLGVFDLNERTVTNRFKIIERLSATGYSPQQLKSVDSFFDWVDQLHHVNYAEGLGARPATIGTGAWDLPLIQTALRDEAQQEPPPSLSDNLDIAVRVPSARILRGMTPRTIMELREYGIDWRSSAIRFINAPNAASRHGAEIALEQFSRKLRGVTGQGPLASANFKAFALKAAPALLATVTDLVAPSVGPYLTTVAGTGYIAYQYVTKNRTGKVRIQIRAESSFS
ncbi:hypothetical protein [Streptomyces galbus]|uniref:Uncharacterized protein n=1 Tax=Streptomyces galbus TaxID=33898 RepID=A0A4U5X2L8_STRGB|nr:hypothetical protein [Streptomyces galbus]TKT09289.1 hypothetical protein E4U92_11535 [Streptomyces galbus]GHD29232.1 hypothetical protein GCM10010335_17720 [Streptomyces galbus]